MVDVSSVEATNGRDGDVRRLIGKALSIGKSISYFRAQGQLSCKKIYFPRFRSRHPVSKSRPDNSISKPVDGHVVDSKYRNIHEETFHTYLYKAPAAR
jgi:hypothetical protein